MKDKIITILKAIWAFLTSSKVKTFYWQTINAFIILIITYLADFNIAWVPFAIAGLNFLTKFINKKYLS